MKVICKNNNIHSLDSALIGFAFTQDEKGVVDISIDKEYTVYEIRKNDLGTFYLVLTDEINTKLPWWMPADFYTVSDDRIPATWKTDTWDGFGKETFLSEPIYFDADTEVTDRTPRGYEVFEQMRKNAEM